MYQISIFLNIFISIILMNSVIVNKIEAGSTPVVLWHGMGKKINDIPTYNLFYCTLPVFCFIVTYLLVFISDKYLIIILIISLSFMNYE